MKKEHKKCSFFICFIDDEKNFIDGLSMFVIRWSCSFSQRKYCKL